MQTACRIGSDPTSVQNWPPSQRSDALVRSGLERFVGGDDAQLIHLVFQNAPCGSEDLSRAGLVILDLLQGISDELLFKQVDRFTQSRFSTQDALLHRVAEATSGFEILRQVIGNQRGALGQDQGTLDHVLQFPNIAGPRVLREQVERVI